MNAVRSLITRLVFKSDRTGLNKYNSSVEKLKTNLDDLKYKALAFAAVLGTTGAFALKSAGEMEQFQIGFDTMLGSAEAGTKMMRELRALTLKTPFSFQQSALGAKRLMAFGISAEKVIPALKNLGNIASGVGMHKLKEIITAYGQIKTARFLRGQEIRQLTESGIPIIEELAVMLKKTPDQITAMSRASKITFKHVEQAIQRLSNGTGRFANLMERQSKSLLGMFSIAKDTLYLMAADFGSQFIPIIQRFVKEMGGVKEVVEKIVAGFRIIIASSMVYGLWKIVGVLKAIGIAGLMSWLKIGIPFLLIGGAVIALGALLESLWVTLTDESADTYLRRMYAQLAYDYPEVMEKLEKWWYKIGDAIDWVITKWKELNFEFDLAGKIKKMAWTMSKFTPVGPLTHFLEYTGLVDPTTFANRPKSDSGSQSIEIDNVNINQYMSPNEGGGYPAGREAAEGFSDTLQRKNQTQEHNTERMYVR